MSSHKPNFGAHIFYTSHNIAEARHAVKRDFRPIKGALRPAEGRRSVADVDFLKPCSMHAWISSSSFPFCLRHPKLVMLLPLPAHQ